MKFRHDCELCGVRIRAATVTVLAIYLQDHYRDCERRTRARDARDRAAAAQLPLFNTEPVRTP